MPAARNMQAMGKALVSMLMGANPLFADALPLSAERFPRLRGA